jgi:hypothetical protein
VVHDVLSTRCGLVNAALHTSSPSLTAAATAAVIADGRGCPRLMCVCVLLELCHCAAGASCTADGITVGTLALHLLAAYSSARSGGAHAKAALGAAPRLVALVAMAFLVY